MTEFILKLFFIKPTKAKGTYGTKKYPVVRLRSHYTTSISRSSAASRLKLTRMWRQTWPTASAVGTTVAAIQDWTIVRRDAK